MEIFGGFMVMMSFISLFLAVVWLIMPFVVFAIKGKQDRTLEILEAMEKRLAAIESRLQQVETERSRGDGTGCCDNSPTLLAETPPGCQHENTEIPPEAVA